MWGVYGPLDYTAELIERGRMHACMCVCVCVSVCIYIIQSHSWRRALIEFVVSPAGSPVCDVSLLTGDLESSEGD